MAEYVPTKPSEEESEFIKNIEVSVLKSLLEKGQLSKVEFDSCMKKLN